MIKVKALKKYYGSVQAVRGISFNVNDGEIVGFLGANGAGKSTTLKVITGYLIPTAGTVEVNDYNILEHTHEIQQMVGYLPEFNPLYPEMKVHDYLEFVGAIREIRGKQFKQALSRVVDQCGLKGVVHREIGTCSKGYKQRIGLAAAMLHDPEILILDEPVTGLDPNQIVEIRELIKKLGKEKLVLISSHILQEIQATVDRIVIIHEGQIVADGTSDELISNFMGNTFLTLEVKNADQQSLDNLSVAIAEVKMVKVEAKKGYHLLQLEYPRETDPRENIFQYAVHSQWVILKMTPRSTNLEDLFRQLTLPGGAHA